MQRECSILLPSCTCGLNFLVGRGLYRGRLSLLLPHLLFPAFLYFSSPPPFPCLLILFFFLHFQRATPSPSFFFQDAPPLPPLLEVLVCPCSSSSSNNPKNPTQKSLSDSVALSPPSATAPPLFFLFFLWFFALLSACLFPLLCVPCASWSPPSQDGHKDFGARLEPVAPLSTYITYPRLATVFSHIPSLYTRSTGSV